MNVNPKDLKYNVQLVLRSSSTSKNGDGVVQFGFKCQNAAVQLEQLMYSPEIGDGTIFVCELTDVNTNKQNKKKLIIKTA